jgi:hypothetical protein
VRAVRESLVLAEIQVDAADELAAEDRVGDEQCVIIRRVARDADVADAQLGLRRLRARHDNEACGQRGGEAFAGLERQTFVVRRHSSPEGLRCERPPIAKRLFRETDDVVVAAIADGDQRRDRRCQLALVKRADVAGGHRGQRRFGPDRRVAVRMRAVEQLQKRAVRDGARHVAQLHQAMHAQLPHAREILLAQRRTHDDVGQDAERAIGEAAEDRRAEDDRVRSDVGVEMRAEPRERLMHLDGGSIAAALVEHVGRNRGQPFARRRIRRRAASHEQHHRDERHLRVIHGPHPEAVRQRRFPDRRKRKRSRRPRLGQSRAIDL